MDVLHFLGTGTAFQNDGRAAQTLLVESRAGSHSLVDVGPSALASLQGRETDWSGLDRLFVTHLHGDHTAGWPFVLLALDREQRRRRAFDVWGPHGTAEHLGALARACYGGLLAEARLGFELRVHELDATEQEGLAIAAGLSAGVVPLDHHPSSIGWRLSAGGRSLAVSGDTRWCDALVRLVRPAGVRVVECTSVAPLDGHLSLDELRAGREALGPGPLFLVHLTDEVATALAADPLPETTAAYDGLSVPLP